MYFYLAHTSNQVPKQSFLLTTMSSTSHIFSFIRTFAVPGKELPMSEMKKKIWGHLLHCKDKARRKTFRVWKIEKLWVLYCIGEFFSIPRKDDKDSCQVWIAKLLCNIYCVVLITCSSGAESPSRILFWVLHTYEWRFGSEPVRVKFTLFSAFLQHHLTAKKN